MEQTSTLTTNGVLNGNSTINHPDRDKSSQGVSGFFPAIVNMIAEDGQNFFQYLKSLGLSRENNLVVLSSRHHYYYDENELKSVSTLVNLRKLNAIKYLDEFLFTLLQVLPSDTNFIGCFYDSGIYPENGNGIKLSLKALKKILYVLDSGTKRLLVRSKVTELLETHGFKVTDMTEMNGLTYFCSQKIHKSSALRA
ncbi:MAG: hypothetical protein Q8868_12385 [Bacteroidota bacterium]|nr:hypothetical protein [Bacteroidota bacterium]